MTRLTNPRIIQLAALTAMIVVTTIFFQWLCAAHVLLPVGQAIGFCDEGFLLELSRSCDDLRLFITGTSSLLAENYVEPHIGKANAAAIPAESLDFVFTSGNEIGLEYANKVLKIDGVAAIQLVSSNDSSQPFAIPPNFRVINIRQFVPTVAAIRKVSNVKTSANKVRLRPIGRRILAVPELKKEALNGLEDVALEPLSKKELRRRLGRTWYLSDLLGDSLAEYPRRVFVDVGQPGRTGSEDWFAGKYPTRNLDFEIIRVDVDYLVSSSSEGNSPVVSGGMSVWLRKNVREEDYVVMKAEADAVEEMVKGKVVNLVYELFLECPNQWQKRKGGIKSRRAYWECLALYGKLRDEGVAVHQWWV